MISQKYVDELIEPNKIKINEEYNGKFFDMNVEAESNKIIVWCQTGSFKATILSSLLNFFLVVGFEGDFLYAIIDKNKVQKNQVIY